MPTLDSDNGHFSVPKQADTGSTTPEAVHDVDSEKGSSPTEAPTCSAAKKSAYQSLGWLDRLLALWILLAIIIGIVIGNFADGAEEAINRGRFVQVSVPVAVGLLVMVCPLPLTIKIAHSFGRGMTAAA